MKSLCLAILTLLCCRLGLAEVVSVEELIEPRPAIEDYSDQTRFVADVLAWERRRDELLHKLRSGQLKARPAPEPTDWHHVTGPEDLETAVRNAEGYVQPRYREQYRFNRTTHISFPLEHLEADEMAHEAVAATAPQQAMSSDLPAQIFDQLQRFQEVSELPAKPEEPSLHLSVVP